MKAKITPEWQKLHARSARSLLQAESFTLAAMRRTLRREIAVVVGQLAFVGDVAERHIKSRAITTIRQVQQSLQGSLEHDIRMGRAEARRQAYGQLQHELALVRIQLSRHGYEEPEHPDDPPFLDGITEEDVFQSTLSAGSLAGAWAQSAYAFALGAINEDSSIARAVARTSDMMAARIERTATVEAAAAFQDEHDEGVGWVGEQNQDAGWAGALFKVWNAILDRATCDICGGHDGDIVLPGFSFDGDEPGRVHLRCRCTSSLVFLPIHLTKTVPGFYTGLEDDEDAA